MNPNSTLFRSLPHPWDLVLTHAATVLVWGLLFGLIFLLRSFFLLLFLTFVFAYIQAGGVTRLAPYLGNRTLRVVLVALFFLGILSATGIFLVPKVKTQTEVFARQFTTYLNRADQELFRLGQEYPLLGEMIPELLPPAEEIGAPEKKGSRYSPTASLLQQFLGFGEEASGVRNINQLLDTLGNIGGKIASIASAFLLSLLFSFLIVLDLPKLGASVRELEFTKLQFIYLSVADNIREFAHIVGKALEAQLILAIIHSILTAVGITIHGLGQHVAFLSVIVFFCSFLPVIGVFISSAPICLIALQSIGLQTMLLAVLLITVIHLIESYILNPKIYGSYMRINAVIILIILTVGGKLFGFWGLILGVPVCTYIFGHAIRRREYRPI
jgi:predicted PurR-regulated permease PerM